ncbi:hypothetical protein E2C01_094378 [Portunus trituberculatus]|uniref:Uncharacterized protein n=1 Tax=Portunus trituberculatus TaxID=210409 RepID=A0A5B7JXE9_PORTR|nr:hypothetical protein [Portunus trituberculatus]
MFSTPLQFSSSERLYDLHGALTPTNTRGAHLTLDANTQKVEILLDTPRTAYRHIVFTCRLVTETRCYMRILLTSIFISCFLSVLYSISQAIYVFMCALIIAPPSRSMIWYINAILRYEIFKYSYL